MDERDSWRGVIWEGFVLMLLIVKMEAMSEEYSKLAQTLGTMVQQIFPLGLQEGTQPSLLST